MESAAPRACSDFILRRWSRGSWKSDTDTHTKKNKVCVVGCCSALGVRTAFFLALFFAPQSILQICCTSVHVHIQNQPYAAKRGKKGVRSRLSGRIAVGYPFAVPHCLGVAGRKSTHVVITLSFPLLPFSSKGKEAINNKQCWHSSSFSLCTRRPVSLPRFFLFFCLLL
jgi:hypothetical protein